ncbi:MAG: hypothetical protein R3A52_32260, partial [Polyangiales bacterium]
LILPKSTLGPFQLPAVKESVPRRFLLDGEQRLMTLYFALHRPQELTGDEAGDESAAAFEVFYDLESQQFVTRDDVEGEPSATHFPLRDVFVPRGVLRFQRELEESLKRVAERETREEDREAVDRRITTLIERTDTLAEAIRQFKIPITTMATDDVGLTTETFKRVNSQGVTMRESHMVNAVAWSGSFDLLGRFNDLRLGIEGHPLWQNPDNLDDDVLLRVAKRLLGSDVYDEKVSEVASGLRDGPEILERVGASMARCADFLASRGLRNPDHIPNVMQLVILGVVFDAVPEPTEAAKSAIEDWLWVTSYAEVFVRVVRGNVYKHYEKQVLKLAAGESITTARRLVRKPLPRFDFRSLRSRTLSWMFAQRLMPVDAGRAAEALATGGSEVMLRLLNPSGAKKLADVVNRSANRVLATPTALNALRAGIKDGSVDPRLLDAHVLSPAAGGLSRAAARCLPLHRDAEADLNALEDDRFQTFHARLFSGETGCQTRTTRTSPSDRSP